MARPHKDETDKRKLRPRQPLIIAMEDFDLSFTSEEVNCVRTSWVNGTPTNEIAAAIHRKDEEVVVLIIDLSYHGKIGARPGGLMGQRMEAV